MVRPPHPAANDTAPHDTGRVWEWLEGIPDPEMPYVSIVDLGIVREVRWESGVLHVAVTPTYSGCPAKAQIDQNILQVLRDRGIGQVRLETRLHPAWSTDWLSAGARARMAAAGIAPPLPAAPQWQYLRFIPAAAAPAVACPLCGSLETRRQAEFSGTACKALYHCAACRNPFEYLKSL